MRVFREEHGLECGRDRAILITDGGASTRDTERADALDPETTELLLERAREDPGSVLRSYPGRAQELARVARAEGLDCVADHIDGVLDGSLEGSS